ncbi:MULTISPECIES: exodeoxyribonuclease V subunit gamma [unclassified Acinetobacter]|uniref:exodeoxyribonuclease V subunit gamma n=1 Tax=unclassified Acinetobacter TaxID=196816 RepID=UPI0029345C51|nr:MULTISPECIES: exodeoxyribonuclease V subunit gamma [unclassified Acinetobacter]WOE30588.1 exodeoxyribonuclease V subunit gamma [Acinetobacter sp. SAAs470]WOE38780.1 exodeoxyribonuclease V subunit gamma [Acinetobacter sp. SAAs474]
MGIHVIQSQRIDVLLHAMLKTTKQSTLSPFDALKTQHIIVPSAAIETWLNTQIAEQQGISANIQFYHRIRGFQWSAYQWVLDAHKDKVRKANIPRIIIKWRIFQLLKPYIEHEQSHLDQQHPLFPIIQRIYASAEQVEYGMAQQLKKQDMLYWVAEQVSKLFSHYMTYRSEWLNHWHEHGVLDIEHMFFNSNTEISAFTLQQAQELEGWQRWLWQQGFSQDFIEIQQIDQLFWQALGDPLRPDEALKKLPPQLVVFTLLDLPPSQLNFLRQLGQYIDIFVFHYNPSQEYWADSVDPHWKTRYDVRVKERFIEKNPHATDAEIQQFFAEFSLNFNAQNRESRHPLLTRLGKQARDHFSLLSSLSSGEEGMWADLFVNEYADHLLAKVQSDILYLAEPEPHHYVLQPNDDSIQIHVCHSAQRQLEVLKDHLIDWLSKSTIQQPRKPSDILVLMPNLKQLEPLIRSHFAPPPYTANSKERLSTDSIYLPIQIAGVMRLDVQHAWRAVLGRIELVQGRFYLEDFADWLSLNATLCRYDLEINQVRRMVILLEKAGFKRGFDDIHLQQSLSHSDQDYRFSFKFALDRLALGIAIPEHTVFQNILSDGQVLPSDFELIAKLIEIYQDFLHRRDWMIGHELGEILHVEQWFERLMQDVSEFIQAGVEALNTVYTIIKKYQRMLTLANFYDQDQQHALDYLSLPLPYLIAEINQMIEGQLEQAEPTGYITFSQIGQIRPVPYKLVVMLNLDSGKFPNRNVHLPFDLMQLLKPQLGDRSRLEDDQGAFLDVLLLAQENLWLFYNGFDVSDGEVREPSHVLQELIQHLTLIIRPDPHHATMQTVMLNGLAVPQHLQSLYHVHPLQPFDPNGFENSSKIRYQDQWFRVAQQIRYAQGSAQQWANVAYPVLDQDVQVLDSQQWINDITFPARLYLKSIGVQNLNPQDIPDQFEPLLLDGLARYSIRHFLHQHDGLADPALLMDQLPVGKIQHSAWQMSQLEQRQLQQRLQCYAATETVTTSQLWRIEAQLYMNISLPKQHHPDWVTLSAASARANRRAKLWLEYLLWLAYLNLGQGGTDYQRIMVFSDQTIICQGVSSEQARQYLTEWLKAWRYGQSQPLVLPAALLLKCMEKDQVLSWHGDEQGRMLLDQMPEILKLWNDNGQFSSFDVTANEASKFHRDWQFILQQQDALLLLQAACEDYAYRLYAPIFCYQHAIKD